MPQLKTLYAFLFFFDKQKLFIICYQALCGSTPAFFQYHPAHSPPYALSSCHTALPSVFIAPHLPHTTCIYFSPSPSPSPPLPFFIYFFCYSHSMLLSFLPNKPLVVFQTWMTSSVSYMVLQYHVPFLHNLQPSCNHMHHHLIPFHHSSYTEFSPMLVKEEELNMFCS